MESPAPASLADTQNGQDCSKHVESDSPDQRAVKRVKLDPGAKAAEVAFEPKPRERMKGVAMIKEQYLIKTGEQRGVSNEDIDDDVAEGRTDGRDAGNQHDKKRRKQKGQNKERDFGRFSDSAPLCNSRVWTPEFSPKECKFGDRCKNLHDLRKYLKEGRRGDLDTLGGKCPVFEVYGRCPSGWRCRFVSSHMKEVEREDGRKELVLVEGPGKEDGPNDEEDDAKPGILNVISFGDKIELARKRVDFEKSETYLKWLTKDIDLATKHYHKEKEDHDEVKDYRAQYVEPPLKPSEKRRLYFGRETPVLAPLTTQGNLPFRRLCVELGAQTVYSEMALSVPIIQGAKSEWALMKVHESETKPPRYNPENPIVHDYDNSRDVKFGAQIAANTYWSAIKAAEALTHFLPHLRLIDLNCGCPIDMVYNSGSGSALLDAPSKLERMIRGMGAVSGEVPITAKIRMGVRDDKPTAQKLIERLALGPADMRDRVGSTGCAAVTLHGRSRQQRYTRVADWGYIAECAAMIKTFGKKKDAVTDTAREPEENTLPNGGKMYFLGNGDCFSHEDYFNHIDNALVDTVMIGRGAIIKPWIFEEIEKGQYLDKSASERLSYIEKFARYGLEAWGSDELGVGLTRRFLLDFLSFYRRYIPIGLLEHLPPSLNDRPPRYHGRNDLETLLASDNCKDWIKISEMFLGPAHPDFKFLPKHKANSYEIEAEG